MQAQLATTRELEHAAIMLFGARAMNVHDAAGFYRVIISDETAAHIQRVCERVTLWRAVWQQAMYHDDMPEGAVTVTAECDSLPLL